MDIIIAGAGISGLSLGHMLHDEHNLKILEANKLGGLIRCERHEEHLYHLVGGHVFNSKNKAVLNWFWSIFDKQTDFRLAKRKAQIWLNGGLVSYPIENYLYMLPSNTTKQIVGELIEIVKRNAPTNFEDICRYYPNYEAFLIGNFGKTLYELYFEPYNKKIWQQDLASIALPWLEGKLPMPNVVELIQQNILRHKEANMVHSSFYYPKTDGSQFIAERLAQGLDISENTAVKSIAQQGEGLLINDHLKCQRLVFTGDIRQLPDILVGPALQAAIAPHRQAIAKLQSNGTSNLLCRVDSTDCSWLYLPESDLLPHRIIYTGNFAASNNAASGRTSATVEFAGILPDELLYEQLAKLSGNPEAISVHKHAASYIIQDNNTRQLIANIKLALQPFGIALLGRFAEWEYYNMDKCVEAAMLYKQGLNA